MPSEVLLGLMIATHAALTVWAYYVGLKHGAQRIQKEILEVLAEDAE